MKKKHILGMLVTSAGASIAGCLVGLGLLEQTENIKAGRAEIEESVQTNQKVNLSTSIVEEGETCAQVVADVVEKTKEVVAEPAPVEVEEEVYTEPAEPVAQADEVGEAVEYVEPAVVTEPAVEEVTPVVETAPMGEVAVAEPIEEVVPTPEPVEDTAVQTPEPVEEVVPVEDIATPIPEIEGEVPAPEPVEVPEYTEEVVPNVPVEQVTPTATDLNARIAEEALKLVGITDGLQCTEVVQLAMANAGVSNAMCLWPKDYQAMYGVYTDNPQAGNLIYYNGGGDGLDHIAIYVGDGMAVHGNYTGEDGVSRTVVSSAYQEGFASQQYIQIMQ